MAIITEDVILKKRGGYGHAITFSSYRGLRIVKQKALYVYRNTPKQQVNRAKFRNAVKSWQGLDIMTQYLWRALAYGKGMSGYEYFIKKFMVDRT